MATGRDGEYWTRGGRYTRRTVLRVAGAIAAAGTVAACGRSSAGSAKNAPAAAHSQPKPGGTLNLFATGNAADLDPHRTGSAMGSQPIVGHVLSRLLRFEAGADPAVTFGTEVEADLALSWESPDAQTWTFKLRPGAKFHDIAPVNGHAVEAADIKASFQRALSIPENPGRAFVSMVDANQITTPASDTVVFKLKSPDGPFPKTIAASVSAILPREALAGSYNPSKVVIGSGPFTMDSYTPDVAMVFKKNPNWYEAGHPYVDVSRVAIIPDSAQQLAQFTAGNLDLATPIAMNDLPTAQASNPRAQVINVLQRAEWIVFSHLNDPTSPYRDVRVRRALSLAIDRDAIGRSVLGNKYAVAGLAQPAFGKWAMTLDQLGTSAQNFKYDPTTAKQLVSAAGAADAFHTLYYPVGGYGPQFEAAIQAMNPMLNAVGFKTRTVQLDFLKDFNGGGKGITYGFYPLDALSTANVGGYSTIEDWLVSNFVPGTNRDKTQVEDQTLVSMSQKMTALTDENERLKAVYDIERYIADQVYYVVAPYPYIATLVQPRVQNYQYSVNTPETESYTRLWLAL